MTETITPKPARRRNPRGQGKRLREEIIAAADALLAESGDTEQLTLRGVARRIGIAATSVYAHFPDVDHLALAVAERHFAQLGAEQWASEQALHDPAEILLARCRTYCRFAMRAPAYYRIMFMADLGPNVAFDFEQAPGRAAFDALVEAIKACQEAGQAERDRDPFRLATLVWAAEHGLVSLRMARRRFPWPPLDELVDDAVSAVVGLHDSSAGARSL